jgi:hypothetical protein
MIAIRFDSLIRSLASRASRRGALAALASGLLVVGPLALGGHEAEAKKKQRKKTRKPSFNAYGCLNVGQACGGSDDRCCSGICEGRKPKKGKKDTSRCVAHNAGDCTTALNVCTAGLVASKCGDAGADAHCMTTTGNASFCGHIETFDPEINCLACGKDADCEAITGPGSACVVFDGAPYCTMMDSCKTHGSSKGTACVPAGA